MVRMTWLILGMVLVMVGTAGAKQTTERELSLQKTLMAPCCWTQTLNNHHSGVSTEMRQTIRDMIAEGKTDEAIVAHFKAQYGERILAKPPAKGFNLAAYVLPVAFLLAGGFVTREVLKRWGKTKIVDRSVTAGAIDPEYARRLDDQLKEGA